MKEKVKQIAKEAAREMMLLKEIMPKEFEHNPHDSIYSIFDHDKAQNFYHSARPLNVFRLGQFEHKDITIHEYGTLPTMWTPNEQLGTALEYLMQHEFIGGLYEFVILHMDPEFIGGQTQAKFYEDEFAKYLEKRWKTT